MYQSDQTRDKAVSKKSVNQQWFKYESSYWAEIFRRCSSSVCAKLTKKFLPLLNQPASHGPFWPKLWTALATAFVGIFFRKKFWWGSGPIPVGHWKEFWISWKKRRFQIFQKLAGPSNNDVHAVAQRNVYRLLIRWTWVRTPKQIYHRFLASSTKRDEWQQEIGFINMSL